MLKKIIITYFIIIILLSITCTKTDVKPVVLHIYKAAQKRNVSFFEKYISSREQIVKLMSMISKSDMPDNYKSRIKSKTNDTIQLDYHWIEKSLHFQIILKNKNSGWKVDRIFICR